MGRIVREEDAGLEDCSGLGGEVVRRHIPLIPTIYIPPLAGRERGSAQGQKPWPKDYTVNKLKRVNLLFVRMALVL